MTEYYKTTFSIDRSFGTPEVKGIALMEKVEDIVNEWAKGRLEEPIEDPRTGSLEDDKGATYHIDRGKIVPAGFCRLLLEHPDSGTDAMTWRADIRLATEGDGVDIEVEVRRIGDSNGSLGARANASRPRVIETLFREFKCSFDGQSLTAEAKSISPTHSDSFVNELVINPTRRMPIIVMTENRYGGVFMNANRLQTRLLGLANVFTYSADTARAVNELLPDWLGCWDGAVRIYRPGCSLDDASRQNTFWTWQRMNYIIRTSGWSDGWDQLLLEIGDECSKHSLPQTGVRLYEDVSRQIRQERYEGLLERFKNAEQEESAYQELLTEARDTIADYERQNDEVRRRNNELENETQHLRAQVEQLNIALSYQDLEDAQPEDEASDSPLEFNSIYDVVEHTQKQIDGIRFFSNAEQMAKGSQFPRPYEVYEAFKALDACAAERVQDSLGKSVQEWLSDKNIDYASRESDTTMGKYGDKRVFYDNVNKRRTKMPAHIKLGGGLGESKQLRIHLTWDEDEKKWLIGYIGKHLPTASG